MGLLSSWCMYYYSPECKSEIDQNQRTNYCQENIINAEWKIIAVSAISKALDKRMIREIKAQMVST